MQIFVEKIRLEKGMTINELAKISKVSASHIHNIENGKKIPTVKVMCKLAIALGVPCYHLFYCDNLP